MKPRTTIKVYIDGSNIFYSQKQLGWNIDWTKMKKYLSEKWNVAEFRYYAGVGEGDEEMEKYLKYLGKTGFTPVTKPLKKIKISAKHPMHQLHDYNHIYKSNFDVEMAVDMALDKDNINEMILFSGDSDFEYLVKRLKALGKKVIIFSSRDTLSRELKKEASSYVFIESIKGKIARKPIAKPVRK